MFPIGRAVVVYLILLVILRIAGPRTLGQMTPFDFLVLLLIGDLAQQALVGDDYSITTAVIVVTTIILCDKALGALKRWSKPLDRWLDGTPIVVVEHGRLIEENLRMGGIDREDVLNAARESRGLERLEQVRYAVLEADGKISIIPEREGPLGGA